MLAQLVGKKKDLTDENLMIFKLRLNTSKLSVHLPG